MILRLTPVFLGVVLAGCGHRSSSNPEYEVRATLPTDAIIYLPVRLADSLGSPCWITFNWA